MAITKATASSIAPAAKGDLVAGTATNDAAVLAVGANDTVLTADSSEATGLKWATPSSGGMTLISTTTLTGSSVTLSSIPQTYKDLKVVVRNWLPSVDAQYIGLRFNGDSNANRHRYDPGVVSSPFDSSSVELSNSSDNAVTQSMQVYTFHDYTNTTTWKIATGFTIVNNATTSTNLVATPRWLAYNQTDAITSLEFIVTDTGNFTSGTVLLYGVK